MFAVFTKGEKCKNSNIVIRHGMMGKQRKREKGVLLRRLIRSMAETWGVQTCLEFLFFFCENSSAMHRLNWAWTKDLFMKRAFCSKSCVYFLYLPYYLNCLRSCFGFYFSFLWPQECLRPLAELSQNFILVLISLKLMVSLIFVVRRIPAKSHCKVLPFIPSFGFLLPTIWLTWNTCLSFRNFTHCCPLNLRVLACLTSKMYPQLPYVNTSYSTNVWVVWGYISMLSFPF